MEPSIVFLVWFAGGILGVYDNLVAATQVADARNNYGIQTQGRKALKARVEAFEVQSIADPRDL